MPVGQYRLLRVTILDPIQAAMDKYGGTGIGGIAVGGALTVGMDVSEKTRATAEQLVIEGLASEHVIAVTLPPQ